VAKYHGKTVYIPYGVPGSRVNAVVKTVKDNYLRAELSDIITHSKSETAPVCPHFYECGGCDYLNVKREMQEEYKQGLVLGILEEAGFSGVKTGKIITYDKPLNYRNRAEYKPVLNEGRIALGFNAAKSNRIIPIRNCSLLKPVINEAASIIRNSLSASRIKVSAYDERSQRGYLRHVVLKTNEAGELLCVFCVNSKEIKPFLKDASAALSERIKKLAGVAVNFNTEAGHGVFGPRTEMIAGRPYIIEKAAGAEFKIGPASFFQVNALMLEHMSSFIRQHLRQGYSVLDLYGGLGALSFPFREKMRSLTVVEENSEAVESLVMNIKRTKTRNVTAVCAKSEEYGVKMINERKHDLLIADPPRSGLHPKLINAINRNGPGCFIYISCNPQSFGRDISELKGNYRLIKAVPLDQFAQTYHVEVMAYLERKTGQAGDSED